MSKERISEGYVVMTKEERHDKQCKLIIDAHQKYVDWWLPIDVAGGSNLAPMGLLRFMEYLLTFEDEEWFDRWIDKEGIPIPKTGGDRSAKLYMKDFILKHIVKHRMGWIDLHNKGNQFTEIEKDDDS